LKTVSWAKTSQRCRFVPGACIDRDWPAMTSLALASSWYPTHTAHNTTHTGDTDSNQ